MTLNLIRGGLICQIKLLAALTLILVSSVTQVHGDPVPLPPVESWSITTRVDAHPFQFKGAYMGSAEGHAYFLTPPSPANGSSLGRIMVPWERLTETMQAELQRRHAALPGFFTMDSDQWEIAPKNLQPEIVSTLDLCGLRLGMTDAQALAALIKYGFIISPVHTELTATGAMAHRTKSISASMYWDAKGQVVSQHPLIALGQPVERAEIKLRFGSIRKSEQKLQVVVSVDLSDGVYLHHGTKQRPHHEPGTVTRIVQRLRLESVPKIGAPGREGNWKRFFGPRDNPSVDGYEEVLSIENTSASLRSKGFEADVNKGAL